MPIGKVVYWNEQRGFGLLSDHDDRASRGVFLHASDCPGRAEPAPGAAFEYDIAMDGAGRTRAIALRALTVEQAEAARVLG